MITSDLLAWLGVVATVIFGAASVYLVLRRRYPGRLAFLVEKEISLFEDIARNLPELSVAYDGKPVSETLVLLRAVVLNRGDKDITAEMAARPLELALPEGFVWRTARLVRTSADVRATATIADPRRLLLDLGLFRRDEHLTLEAVAEVPALSGKQNKARGRGAVLSDAITFHHRIADTAPVETGAFPSPPRPAERRQVIAMLINVVVMLGIVLLARFFSQNGEFRFLLDQSGQPVARQASPYRDRRVQLEREAEHPKSIISLEEFQSRLKGVVIVPSTAEKRLLSLVALAGVATLLFALPVLVAWRRSREYRRLLESPATDDTPQDVA
ncbi:MAG: hypothetical protein ACYDBY_07315 [Thermoanaerobaculia bacterium]